jgi:hypothetical protein
MNNEATSWRQLSPARRGRLNEAVKEARLAYEFSPGSYTHGAALLNAATFTEPDWVNEYLDWAALDLLAGGGER